MDGIGDQCVGGRRIPSRRTPSQEGTGGSATPENRRGATPSSVIVPAGSGERGRRLLCALHADTLRTLYESVARTMLSKTVPMMLRRREVRNDGGLFLF